MKELHASWEDATMQIPLIGLFLMLRQEQAKRVENIMTLSDKELIEKLTKKSVKILTR